MAIDVHILCADWAKVPNKRRVWEIRRSTTAVRSVTADCGTDFVSILQYARCLDGPVILGIDAAIGVPAHIVKRFSIAQRCPQADFFAWIQWLFNYGQPDLPALTPGQWSYARPFISILPGKGTRNAFTDNGIILNRQCEAGLGSNSPIIVSGIPGTVGSGSRELWRELAQFTTLPASGEFRRWPFDGNLNQLLREKAVVLAEIYPKACYGIALCDSLPANLMAIAKTRAEARSATVSQLLATIGHALKIENIGDCYSCEDDFDAMISTVALYRLLESGCGFGPENAVNQAEGAILGKSALMV